MLYVICHGCSFSTVCLPFCSEFFSSHYAAVFSDIFLCLGFRPFSQQAFGSKTSVPVNKNITDGPVSLGVPVNNNNKGVAHLNCMQPLMLPISSLPALTSQAVWCEKGLFLTCPPGALTVLPCPAHLWLTSSSAVILCPPPQLFLMMDYCLIVKRGCIPVSAALYLPEKIVTCIFCFCIFFHHSSRGVLNQAHWWLLVWTGGADWSWLWCTVDSVGFQDMLKFVWALWCRFIDTNSSVACAQTAALNVHKDVHFPHRNNQKQCEKELLGFFV